MFTLSGKVIVVTGGTGVLGETFIKGISNAGGKVVIIGRNKAAGQQREQEIIQQGQSAMFLQANVLNEKELDTACHTIIDRWGTIDGLVNAAGGNIPQAILEPGDDIFSMNIDGLRQAFELNLFGTILPTLIFGKHIASHKGSIVNISSMASQTTVTRVLGYSMAKAAVDNFTRWMALELSNRYGDKLRVNAIAPGFFLTSQNKELLIRDDGTYSSRSEAIIRNTPFKRFGQPEELAGILIWLLSDASRFVTGEVICVDGGFHIFSGV